MAKDEEKIDLAVVEESISDHNSDDDTTTSTRLSETKISRVKSWFCGNGMHTLSSILVHAPALIVSTVLVAINSLDYFWFEVGATVQMGPSLQLSTSNIFHLLQLAAKAYELIFILSLSAIVLGIYIAMLSTVGLPLGLITSGHRTGSLMYLKHSSLLSGAMVHRRYLLFGLFIIFSTGLSMLAGPACAILMVPTPGWWSMGGEYADIMPPVLYTRPRETIWPAVLDASVFPQTMDSCKQMYAVYDNSCPGYGHSDIAKWATVWGTDMPRGNITVRSAAAITEMHRQILAELPSNDSATFTTTLSSATGLVIGAYFDYVTRHDVGQISHTGDIKISTLEHDQNYQPLMQTKCKAFEVNEIREALKQNDSSKYPYWPMDGVQCFNDPICASWQNRTDQDRAVDSSYWDYAPEQLNYSFQWVETEGPLSAVFNLPYLEYPAQDFNEHPLSDVKGAVQEYYIMTCSFVSRWVPSVTTAEPLHTDTLRSNISDPGVFAPGKGGGLDDTAVGFPVQIKKSWADYLDFNLTTTVNQARSEGAMSGLIDSFVNCVSELNNLTRTVVCSFMYSDPARGMGRTVPRVVEKLLGIAVADGMSRVGLTRSWADNASIPEVSFELTPERIRYLYLVNMWGLPGIGELSNYTIVPNPGNDSHPSIIHFNVNDGTTLWQASKKSMRDWLDDFDSFHSFGLAVERYGYGSGATSPTLTFALVVVYLYMATVAVYLLASLWYMAARRWRGESRRRGIAMGCDDDIQDLVALAWRSEKPRGLKEVKRKKGSARLRLKAISEAWKQVVVVRASQHERLELVLRDGDDATLRPPHE